MDGAIFVRCLASGIHGECSPLDQPLVALALKYDRRPARVKLRTTVKDDQ
jgi:hypothetical protein